MKRLLILVVLFTFYSSIFCEYKIQKPFSQETLKTICQYFPGSFQSICANILKDNLKIHADIKIEMESNKEVNPPEGKVCKFVLQKLIKKIGSDHSEETIKKELKDSCGQKSFITLRKKCVAFVDKYTNDIIKHIQENIPVDEICKKIGQSKNEEVKYDKETKRHPSKKCIHCIKIVKIFERIINTSLTTELVLKQLIGFTEILKSPLKEKAKIFLKIEGPKIIMLILNQTCPKIICQEENICKKIEDMAQFKNEITSSSDSTNQCSTCNLVSKALSNFQNQKLTKEQSSKALETVCYFVPTSKTEECTKFVNDYENEISNFMTNNIKINPLCNSLKLCKSKKKLSDTLFFLPILKFQ